MSNHNIFETIDKSMSALNITKKMFVLMILTVIVLPPSMIVGTNLVAEYMKNEGEVYDTPKITKLVLLVDELEKGEITPQEYLNETKYVLSDHTSEEPGPGFYISLIYPVVYVFWIGYGIRQWVIFTRLSKQYNQSKTSGKIFGIVDDAMNHVKTTKKMFLIVTIAGIVIHHLLILGFGALVIHPIQAPVGENFGLILQLLENNTITIEQFVEQFRVLKSEYTEGVGLFGPTLFLVLIMFANATVWLVYGIKQYMILHKWNKRYHTFKEKDKEIDRKLIDE